MSSQSRSQLALAYSTYKPDQVSAHETIVWLSFSDFGLYKGYMYIYQRVGRWPREAMPINFWLTRHSRATVYVVPDGV